jgi:D-glycero-D-manno-heptose 1,7-bisphosphate phosphatase
MRRRAIFLGSFPRPERDADAVRRINAAGWQAVVITNEREIDDGLRSALLEQGARLDGVYHCPHDGGAGCGCRKPAIALLERARDEMGIELEASRFVGYTPLDLDTARAAGMPGMLVGAEHVGTLDRAVARALESVSDDSN